MSTSYWPVVWPAPEPVNLTVYPDSSSLVLPVRPIGVDHGEPSPSCAEPLTSSPTHFHYYAEQEAWFGAERVHSQTWSRSIARDFI